MSTGSDNPVLTEQDREHLHLLSLFHFLVAGATALFFSMFVIHFVVGVSALVRPEKFGPRPPGALFGIVFALMGAGTVLAGWTTAILFVLAGRYLRRQVHYTFCLVVAALGCTCCQPLGTVLGVFTIIVLLRPSVKAAFQLARPA